MILETFSSNVSDKKRLKYDSTSDVEQLSCRTSAYCGLCLCLSPISFDRAIYIPTTAQKMKFFITDFFSKCDQIRRKLRIWSHLLKKSLIKNFIFCAVCVDEGHSESLTMSLSFAFVTM